MDSVSFKWRNSLKISLIFFITIFALPLSASATLEVSFLQQSTDLSIGQEGTWQVQIKNPDSETTTGLTITLPADFTVTDTGGGTETAGPPHTLEWTGISIAAGGTATRTYKARPNCDAVDGQEMEARAGSITAGSDPMTIQIPVVGVDLVDSSGSTVTDAHVGDSVAWVLTVNNSGQGTLAAGADMTFTLGAAFSFVSISSPTGHTLPDPPNFTPGTPKTWNSGEIIAAGKAQYHITATVSGCDRTQLGNDVSVLWTDGLTVCPKTPLAASASVALEILEPDVSITVTNPSPLGYCPTDVTRAQISITNNGTGPAQNFQLQMDGWPDTWQVTPVTAGVTFDTATSTFSIPDVDAGGTLSFQFDIAPTGGCSPTPTATLLFLPQYDNHCGETHGTRYYTPVEGPQTWTMEIPPDKPTFTVEKNGPSQAEVGETGLVYTVRVTYTGPASALPHTVDITDNYPGSARTGLTDGFVVTNITGGGIDDNTTNTITWSGVTFSNPGEFVEYTVTMDAPTDPCAGFHSYCNQATVTPVPNDCRGCAGVVNTAEACTYIKDTHGNIVADSSVTEVFDPADVCTDNLQFTTCYTFDTGAPSDWDGMELDNTMNGTFSFEAPIDGVTVNGTDHTALLSTTFPLDLTNLTGNAPAPDSGAELCVTYTYSVENTEGDFTNTASLTAGGGTGCGASPEFNVAADFSVEGSKMEVTPNSPSFINACETREYTIDIGGFRTLYDARVILDTQGNYIFDPSTDTIKFEGIEDAAGNTISKFNPTDTGSNTYTWDFSSHVTGGGIKPKGTITIEMKRNCTTEPLEWSASGVYNNKCEWEKGLDPQRSTPVSASAPLKILDGDPTLHLVPATVFADTPYPTQALYIINGGSGPLFDVDLTVRLDKNGDNDLVYESYSIPTGANAPDSVTGNPGDHTVVFHYNQIDAGAREALNLTLKLIGCTNLNIDAELTWCDPDSPCDTREKRSIVRLPNSQVLVVRHLGDKLDYCDGQDATFTITAQNSDQADAFNAKLIELLPPGVTYVSTTSVTHTNGYGALTGTPVPTTTMVGNQQQVTWDFSNVLPLNNDSPQARAMKPSSSLEVVFTVQIADCTAAALFSGSEKKASATAQFDPPCNSEGALNPMTSEAKILTTLPLEPHLTVKKEGRNETKGMPWTSDEVDADPDDIIEWRITYTSDGDFKASNVNIRDELPTNVTLASFSSTCGASAATFFTASGSAIGDLAIGASCTTTFKTTINAGGCTTDPTTNTAHGTYGCCTGEPMLQTAKDSVSLRTSPDFEDAGGRIRVNHNSWTSCGGRVTILLTNTGGTAYNQTVVTTLAAGYEADPGGSCTITALNTPSGVTHASFTCPTLSGSTLTWGPGNIDFVAPGETIRIRFWVKTSSSGDCSTSPGRITNSAVFSFQSACGVSGSNDDDDNFTPPHPQLQITKTPEKQTVKEGETATWTITLTNNGNAAAGNITLTDVLGNGFSNPSDNKSGVWVGNTATWSPESIAENGGTWNVEITATANSGSLTNHASTAGKCRDQGGADTCTYASGVDDAYTAAFSIDKSVTPTTANVGELLTYRVTAVFSNTDEFQNVTILDTLPPWVEYKGSQPWPGGNNTINAGTPVLGGSPSAGQTITWKPANFNGRAVFDYEITARVQNNAANVSGTTLTNKAVATFDIHFSDGTTSTGYTQNTEDKTDVTEPVLDLLSKTISPKSGLQAGDTVTITLVVKNTGDGPAYNVGLDDLINDNNAITNGVPDGIVNANDVTVYSCATLQEDTTPTDFTYGVTGASPGCQVVYTGNGDNAIEPGGTRTFVFKANIATTVVTGSIFKNQAETDGWSLKPSDPEQGNTDYNRDTDDSATDAIAPSKVSDSKELTGTSEPSTTDPAMAIGEVADYKLTFSFPAGETRAVTLVDEIPDGLQYMVGSAYLDRDHTDITTASNPGGINANTPGSPVAVTLDESTSGEVRLSLGDVLNHVRGEATHTLILTLKCVVKNTATNNAGTDLTDRGRMDWQDAAGATYQTAGESITVRVAEPVPTITKGATPLAVAGGQDVTFTVKICNDASGQDAASAFDWTFEDPLPAAYQNPVVTHIDTGATGATVTADFSGNILTGTIDRLDPGECITVTYTAQMGSGAAYGQVATNTASMTATSIPGDHGTGDATPGDPGDPTGERTGTGGVNDLSGSDSASVRADIPNIAKTVVSPKPWHAVGEVFAYRITVGVPAGNTNNFVVTDVLPEGLTYAGIQDVVLPAGFTPTLPPQFTWTAATRTLKWDFGNVAKNPPSGNITITYDVRVENILANQDGTVLENSATLNYGTSQSAGPVSTKITVGEPNLYLEKTPQTTPVDLDGGDAIRYRITFWNNGHTTAYQTDWQDVLPKDGLYEITNHSLTIVAGKVYRNGTTTALSTGDLAISTTNNTNDTLSLPLFQMSMGSHFHVEFDCRLMGSVVAGETLTNDTDAAYASQSTGDHTTGVRDCEARPCNDDDPNVLNNYGESASHDLEVLAEIAIVKTLPDGNDQFTIGEDFRYNLRTWVIEGISPDVEVHDDLPTGLTYQSHQINTPAMGIISFSNPNYDTVLGNVWFSMGNVTNAANNDPSDDYFDVALTVRMDNIPGNQDGGTINNSAYVGWSAGPDVPSNEIVTYITEPLLGVAKTVFPSIQAEGGLVTYTVSVGHQTGSTHAAYDLVIADTLPAGLTFVSSTETNYGSGQNLEFRKPVLQQGDQWVFTYTARIASGAADTLENNLDLTWGSVPNADGSEDSGRNGSNCGQTNPLNGYCDLDKTPVGTVTPGVDIQKTVYQGHDSGASCPGMELVRAEKDKPVTYCFRIINTGDTYLDNITITDAQLGISKTDLTFVSGTFPLSPGESTAYYYETFINGSVTNTAHVTATPTDSQGTAMAGISDVTDSDTAAVEEIYQPVLSIAKVDATDPVKPGSDLIYTISYSNASNVTETATNVVITETYDANTTFVSANPVPDAGTNNQWTIGNLTPGQSGNIIITVRVKTPLPNGTALVNAVGIDSDQDSDNAQETTTVQSNPILSINKTDSVDPVKPGEQLTYTITYSNTSDASETATNVVITETYDANTTFVSANPVPDAGTNNQWTIGNLTPGDTGTITVTVLVLTPLPNGTQLINGVGINSSQGSSSAQEVTTVQSNPLLNLSKVSNTNPVKPGDNLTYTITYSNATEASEMITHLVITENYDPNLTFVSASPAPDAGTNNRWTIGNLAPGQSGTIVITLSVKKGLPDGTLIVNVVTADSDQASPITKDVTTVLQSPLLSIQKTDEPDPVSAGENLTYTITYGNDASAGGNATHVVIRETYDENVTFVSAEPAPDDGTNNRWTIGNLAPGAGGTITIIVRVKESLPVGTQIINGIEIDANQGSSNSQAVTTVQTPPIPTLNQWGIIIFLILCSTLSLYYIKRGRFVG